VTECVRLLSSSGDFLLPFTVIVFDEFVVGRTSVSFCLLDLSTAGICEISVLKGISVPLTRVGVFGELVSDTVSVVDGVSC